MKETDWRTSKVNKNDPETGHIGVDRIVPPASGFADYITDEVRTEVAELKSTGVDVSIVDYSMESYHHLDEEKRQLVDAAIETYSAVPGFADRLTEDNPAVAGWLAMAKAKSPLALTFFYNMASMERPSDGLSKQAILNEPLVLEGEHNGKTAAQLIKELNSEKRAELVLNRLEQFFKAGSLKAGVDSFGLTAYDIMAGSLDYESDITRVLAFMSMVEDNTNNSPDGDEQKGLVTASFASGAAEPVFWLMDMLRSQGKQIDLVHLIDMDPVPLAASADRSTHYGMEDKIKMHLQNLIETPINSYIKPKSVRIGDAIGFFEYMPELEKAPLASMFIRNAGEVIEPGGILVFGNMLKSRPQQKWFDGLWPKLQQRSISDVIEIVEKAGFSRDQLKIQIPKEGVYAMYAIEFPKDTSSDVTRRALGRVTSPASLE